MVVDNYKEEISKMKHGEDFLNAYILVNQAVLVYFGGKTILQLTSALPKLKTAYASLKNSDDFAKLKTTNPSKAAKIEKEVDDVLNKVDEIANSADDVLRAIAKIEDDLRQVVGKEHVYKVDSKGVVSGPVIGEADKVNFSSLGPFKEGDVITHNHPRGYSFSVEDIAALSDFKITEVRAVTKNKTYSVLKTGEFKYYEWRIKYDELQKIFKAKYADKIKAGLTFEEMLLIQEELYLKSFEGFNVQFTIQ